MRPVRRGVTRITSLRQAVCHHQQSLKPQPEPKPALGLLEVTYQPGQPLDLRQLRDAIDGVGHDGRELVAQSF